MEREAMEQINRNLASIREEYEKNKEFIGRGFKLPPEFILDGYDDTPEPTPRPTTVEGSEDHQQGDQDLPPADTENNPEAEAAEAQPANSTPPEPTTQAPDSEPSQTKQPRMLARISDELNGPLWRVEPLTKRTRRIVYTIEYMDPGAIPEDGTLEPVYTVEYRNPGDIPEDNDSDPNTDVDTAPESTNAPRRKALVNGDN